MKCVNFFNFINFGSKKALEDLMDKVEVRFRKPLTKLQKISYFNNKLYFKLENENSTGSFKDRVAGLILLKMNKLGYKKFFVNTSGNMGLALTALSNKKKVFSYVLLDDPYYSNIGLLSNKSSFLEIRPNRISFISRILSFFCAEIGVWDFWWFIYKKRFFQSFNDRGFFIAQPSIYINPDCILGYADISFEIFKQLGDMVPDYLITPVINSDNAIGQWLGYYALFKYKFVNKIPHFILVEREKVYRHFNYPDAWQKIKRFSKISLIGVREDEEFCARKYVSDNFGKNINGVSAGCWAAYSKLCDRGFFRTDDVVVLVLSGSDKL
ncbi:MAG: hypothetical protein KatS3mg088_464 [Patescibacteria group bacterium]|nr:MAG: hypothetical protein KatS3mg088_464 [Patescibacteria group bacterium]